jgi:hypothetical protein
MAKRVREDLTELFRLWLDPQEAQDAAREVRAAEEMIESNPAPLPATATLDRIKQQMRLRSIHRRRNHFMEGVAAVAAAIMIVVGLSQYNLNRPSSAIGFASLIPDALWESDDIASDDVKLAYFNSEVDRLEAQVQAIEYGDADTSGAGTLNEVEMELFEIDTDFWKG